MEDRQVIEKRTTVTEQPAQPAAPGQTTNVNVRPDGGADIQVNDGTPQGGAVVEETTTTRRTI